MFHPAAIPENEPERLARLRALAVLDTRPEALFDALTRAAAEVCGTPIAAISLVDEHRQWFKSTVGLAGLTETSRDIGFCPHTLLGRDAMQVSDASTDERFGDNPLVTGPPGIRFYAGAPITLSDGIAVGTVCVIDRQPRQLGEAQLRILQNLAAASAEALEFRQRSLESLSQSILADGRLSELYQSTPAMLHAIGPDGKLLTVSDTWLTEVGYTRDEVIGRHIADFYSVESRRHALETVIPDLFRTGRCDEVEYEMVRKDGTVLHILLSSVLVRDVTGKPLRSMGASQNVTRRRIAENALREGQTRVERILEATQAGTWELDIETGEIHYNERWAEIIGHSIASLGRTSLDAWLARIHPDDRPHVTTQLQAHYDGDVDYYNVECRLWHNDDSWVWVRVRGRVSSHNADGGPLWMHGTQTDISARKRAEASFGASQKFLERVGEVAGVAGWDLDLASGSIHWSQQSDARDDGRRGRPATIKAAIEVVAPEWRPTIIDAIDAATTDGEPFDLELPLVSSRGVIRWTRVVASVERAHGRPVRLVGAFQDITRRKEIEQDLAQNRELLQVTLDSIGDAVITTDTDGIVQWLNPVAERMTGWTKADAVGEPSTTVFVIADEESGLPIRDPVAACLRAARSIDTTGRVTLISRDGTEYGIEDTVSPIRQGEGQVHGTVLVFHDVSEQRRLHREMSHRATHDLLTGLLNRGELEARLGRLLAAGSHGDAMLYIDLDQFKLVNDACGHAAGDHLLQQVSAILRGCVRERDSLARLGGDEFGIILEHCDVPHAHGVAQKICDQMDEFRFVHEGRRFRIGASIGLVPVDGRWATTKALLQAADASCYAAKDGGRNRVHAWFDSDQALKARDGDMQWVSRLEMALDEDRFELFGQRIEPIDRSRASRQGLHFEVLLRLYEANGNLVPPGTFLPVAERFHLATRIDRWVVRNAFEWMRTAAADAVEIEMVSVNLSGQSLGDRAFHRDVIQMIRSASFDVRKLCFEITETAAITHMAEARSFIVEMRTLGVRIALDDFGAGASSFGYLKSLPVDFLKIDGHFITNILEDELNHAAVRCFCDVAKVVGVRTIAEFVERDDVRDALRALGVDMAQGYLIHRPEPLKTLLARKATSPDAPPLRRPQAVATP